MFFVELWSQFALQSAPVFIPLCCTVLLLVLLLLLLLLSFSRHRSSLAPPLNRAHSSVKPLGPIATGARRSRPIRGRERGAARSDSRETDGKELSFCRETVTESSCLRPHIEFSCWPREKLSHSYPDSLSSGLLHDVWLRRPGSLLQRQLRRRRGARRGWRRTEEDPHQEAVPWVPPAVQSGDRPDRVHL